MPRHSREESVTGIYHVMLRGVNRQSIFEDEEDCVRLDRRDRSFRSEGQVFDFFVKRSITCLHAIFKLFSKKNTSNNNLNR